jgi:nucleoside-diphosphate-sugar epimerase
VVAACNAHCGGLRQLVFISSLAACGPGTRERPAREDDPPRPVTAYGESKLLAERHVREESEVPFTILRPCAVYGPRDADLLLAFRAVAGGMMPLVGGGRQPLSFIYAPDLARGVALTLGSQQALGRTYNLAHPVPWTLRAFGARIGGAVGVDPIRLPVPKPLLYAACLWRELLARITSRPGILNLQKIPEYTAPGWVADVGRAARELGFRAPTDLDSGLRRTVRWYREHDWLQKGAPGR